MSEQGTQTIKDVLEPTVKEIDEALGKEGASLDVRIEESTRTVTAALVRHRITCEGCLLPEDLVTKMLKQSLKANEQTRQLRYKVKTENWLS